MKTSYKKIGLFTAAANAYLAKCKEETKLKYAIEKVGKRIPAITEQYFEDREDIEIANANVDKNGSILSITSENGVKTYQYTAEGTKKVRRETKALFEDERYEIKGHFVVDIPEDLDPEMREYFTGFVIAPEVTPADELKEALNEEK